MPIYEYRCKGCNDEFELLLYSGEEPKCPRCGSKNLTKKISVFSTSCSDNRDNSFSYSQSERSSSSRGCGGCSWKSCSTCK
jgi:putative FmdB family regulatory protein